MSDLAELRQRVDVAANQFKRLNDLQHDRWDRLRGMVDKLEAELNDLRGRAAAAKREAQRLADENVELRSMVSTLLRYVEDGSLSRSLSELEGKVARLKSLAGTPVKTGPQAAAKAAAAKAAASPAAPRPAAAPVTPAPRPAPAQSAAAPQDSEGEGPYEQLVVRQISKLARALSEAKSGRHVKNPPDSPPDVTGGNPPPKGKATGQ